MAAMINPDWKNAALLLVGHGSSKVESGRLAACRLAEQLEASGLFAEVKACFWKEEPYLSLDLVQSRTVYVVPYFSGEGVFTRRLIPQTLELNGPLTVKDGRRIYYAAPVGAHDDIPRLLRQRALELCAAQAIFPAAATLLVIAHGSSKPGGAKGTPERIADLLRQDSPFAEVITSYIEQEPFVADWPALVTGSTVLAAPLLLSEGMHASQDLPPLFGLTTVEGGPSAIHGKTAWLMGGIGRDPEMVEIILDLIRCCDATKNVTPPEGLGRIAP